MFRKLCATPSSITRKLRPISEGEALGWGMDHLDPKEGEGVRGKGRMMSMQILGEDIPGLLQSSKGTDGEDIS